MEKEIEKTLRATISIFIFFSRLAWTGSFVFFQGNHSLTGSSDDSVDSGEAESAADDG